MDVYINTTVNGMGERAGDADLVSVILALTPFFSGAILLAVASGPGHVSGAVITEMR